MLSPGFHKLLSYTAVSLKHSNVKRSGSIVCASLV